MESRLDKIQEWIALARPAGYSAQDLAQRRGVSLRQLERIFLKELGMLPHAWLRQLRMQRAVQLLGGKQPIGLIADELCYKYAEHFTRDFKSYFGVAPSKYHSPVDSVAQRVTTMSSNL